jgi:hypothetical protein
MTAYFAYGANMVRTAMAVRCPGTRPIGPALLPDHRFAIIRGGFGTVLRHKGGGVHGVLWQLGRGAAASLDRYEEVDGGIYRRERRIVWRDGRPRPALVYVAAATAPGVPRAAYIAAIVAAARGWGFPADYVAALEAIASTSAGVRPAARSARTLSERSRLA